MSHVDHLVKPQDPVAPQYPVHTFGHLEAAGIGAGASDKTVLGADLGGVGDENKTGGFDGVDQGGDGTLSGIQFSTQLTWKT